MGVGHLAVGFAIKRWAPRTSLGWLLLAPIFVDLLWSLFILLGIERARITPGITKSVPLDLEYIPFSHSLVAGVGWGAVLAVVYFALHRDARVAGVLFVGVLSHWVLDWISHRPDMPVLPSGPRVGLGLWNYPLAAFSVEAGMLAIGVWSYLSATRLRRGAQHTGLAILVVALFAFNAAAYVVPAPPSITPMAMGNLAMIVLLWIAARVDRTREANEGA